MKKLLLATAAALAISTSPAVALKIDSVSFPTEEYIVVILSDIPNGPSQSRALLTTAAVIQSPSKPTPSPIQFTR